jgi:sugar lactone lactonase YvrE
VEPGRILLPEQASNCTFGGADGRRLFITAVGALVDRGREPRAVTRGWTGVSA